jgi:sulfate transport system substrate-binding protein
LIENPIALVDKYVDKHGVRDAAEAFIDFLWTAEGQRAYARYGLRPVVPTAVGGNVITQFPAVQDLWKIDYLGGWKRVAEEIYGPQGVYSKTMEELQKSR